MAFVFKQLGRFVISVTVSILLLSVLVGVIVPTIFENGKIDVSPDNTLPQEKQVIEMRTINKISPTMTVSDAVTQAKGVNEYEELDDVFWQGVLDDESKVYVYTLHNGYHKPADAFSGAEVSDWVLVFTSANAAGEEYTVNVTLSLYDFLNT